MVIQITWAFAQCCFLHLNRALPPQPLFCWHALAHPLTPDAEVTFSRKPSPVPPEQLLCPFPCDLPPLLSSLHSKLLCFVSVSPTRLWTFGGLGAYLLHLSISTAYHSNWNVFRVCQMNLCTNEWMHGNLCLPLGNEMSLKNTLLERTIHKEISIPLPTNGLPYPPAPTMSHPSVRESRTGTHM